MLTDKTVGELQDEVKACKRRIEELRSELDDERELVKELRENVEQCHETIEQFAETGMEMTDSDTWSWKPFRERHDKLVDDYNRLVRDWNRYLPRINGTPRNVGRPLGASDSQRTDVLNRHKAGESLRGIAGETNLSLTTIRTIIAKQSGNDRTTKKYRQRIERIDIDRQQRATSKRQHRAGQYLPKRVNRYLKETKALILKAKGL
jgi:hypothetical protein